MGYRVVYMSRTQWQGSELESGDTGKVYQTKEDAEKAKLDIEENEAEEIYNAAAEAQGLEGWLEIIITED